MDSVNNSFYDARAANKATVEHRCSDQCPRDGEGRCRTQRELWRAQHAAALRWNQPEHERSQTNVEPGRGYL